MEVAEKQTTSVVSADMSQTTTSTSSEVNQEVEYLICHQIGFIQFSIIINIHTMNPILLLSNHIKFPFSD